MVISSSVVLVNASTASRLWMSVEQRASLVPSLEVSLGYSCFAYRILQVHRA